MNTVESELTITEAIFNLVADQGHYDLDFIYNKLAEYYPNITEALIVDGIETLMHSSDLYEYDVNQRILLTQSSYIPLNKQKILGSLSALLSASTTDKIFISPCFVTSSTNTDLEKISLKSKDCTAAVVVAEMQMGGRGRRSKRWVSPLAKNLYFSLKYTFPQAALPHLSSLSLRAGVALLDSLRALGVINAKLKWPNDIWVEGQKLAGILVESTITQSGIDVIIGIGVNNQYDRSLAVVGNHPTCCEAVLGAPIDRNLLVAALTSRLYTLCEEMNHTPDQLIDLMTVWPENSCFYGQKIRLMSDKEEIIGEEVGVDKSGALLIKRVTGEVSALYSGDLSLRAFSTPAKNG